LKSFHARGSFGFPLLSSRLFHGLRGVKRSVSKWFQISTRRIWSHHGERINTNMKEASEKFRFLKKRRDDAEKPGVFYYFAVG
jgi:hypothetical protein